MNKKSATSSLAEIRSLRRQVAALKKQVTRLDKAVRAASKPGRVHASKVVASSLEIVDASGRMVAEISGNGDVFCRSVWASEDKNKRGVFINGGERKISAGLIDLIRSTGNAPAIQMDGSTTPAGQIKLRNVASKQQLVLQTSGSALLAYDENGYASVSIMTNSPAGGSIAVYGRGPSSKASAQIRISHLTNGGHVYVIDAAGELNGSLGR